jgi:ferritin-like metal-binding protein YciE
MVARFGPSFLHGSGSFSSPGQFLPPPAHAIVPQSAAGGLDGPVQSPKEKNYPPSVRAASFLEAINMATESARDVIIRYLEDAIAAEKSFESELRTFAKAGDQPEAKSAFEQHADETRRQHERLTARLESLGGKPSTAKSFMAHLFGMAPSPAQIGHEPAEKNTQHLIIAYAVENSEIAMYEALATVCSAAGDAETERLVREIQAEERTAAEKIWNALPRSARDSFHKVTGGKIAGGGAGA